MTKIYEALEHAKKAKQLDEHPPKEEAEQGHPARSRVSETESERAVSTDEEIFAPSPRVRFREPVLRPFDLKLEKSLALLYHNIRNLLTDSPSKIIQFISARPNEGVPEIIREFAKVCALKHLKKVLLVDIKQGRESQISHFKLNGDIGWRGAMDKNIDLKSIIQQVGDTSLFVTTLLENEYSRPLEPDSKELNLFLEQIGKEYEFVLIDTPSSVTASETLMLSRFVDGLVIVVEAERTRWQVVDRIKQKIIARKGNILGIILNKRRFPIPNFIYKYL